MSRRTAATAATAADTATATAPRSGVRHGVYLTHGGPITPAERAAAADGIRAGAKQRERQLAADIVSNVAAQRESGVNVPDSAFLMPPTVDPLTGESEQADARAILAEAESRAPAHRRGKWTPRDASRMTDTDAARLSRKAASWMGRKSTPRLTAEEWEDAAQDALLELLAHGADDVTTDTRAWFTMPYGTPRADARVHLLEGRLSALPRWDALAAVDAPEDAPAAPVSREVGITARRRTVAAYSTAQRERWEAWSYMLGRRWAVDRAERVAAERAADWTPAGEDETPTAEQRAAMLADRASAHLSDALATVDTDALAALAATAPLAAQRPLNRAERDALAMALSGATRAEIAAARGVDTEAVKKAAQRGRAALAKRVPDTAALREWTREARAAEADGWDRAAAHLREQARVIAPPADSYRAVRLSWPPRMAPCDGGDTGHRPAPITGAGTHARTPAPTVAGPARMPWQQPRRTLTGAAALPAHHLLAPLAGAWRTLNRTPHRDTAPESLTYHAERVDTWHTGRGKWTAERPTVAVLTFPRWVQSAEADALRAAHRAACKRAGRACAI